MDTFNKLVKIIRKEKGFSQKELAKLSDLDRTTISRIEGDENYSPTLKTAERISNALGIDLSMMLNQRHIYSRKLYNQYFLKKSTSCFVDLTFNKLNNVIVNFYLLCDVLSTYTDGFEIDELYISILFKRSMKQTLNRDYKFDYENNHPILISKNSNATEHIILFYDYIEEVKLPIYFDKEYLVIQFSSDGELDNKIIINKIYYGYFKHKDYNKENNFINNKTIKMLDVIYNDYS